MQYRLLASDHDPRWSPRRRPSCLQPIQDPDLASRSRHKSVRREHFLQAPYWLDAVVIYHRSEEQTEVGYLDSALTDVYPSSRQDWIVWFLGGITNDKGRRYLQSLALHPTQDVVACHVPVSREARSHIDSTSKGLTHGITNQNNSSRNVAGKWNYLVYIPLPCVGNVIHKDFHVTPQVRVYGFNITFRDSLNPRALHLRPHRLRIVAREEDNIELERIRVSSRLSRRTNHFRPLHRVCNQMLRTTIKHCEVLRSRHRPCPFPSNKGAPHLLWF